MSNNSNTKRAGLEKDEEYLQYYFDIDYIYLDLGNPYAADGPRLIYVHAIRAK